MKIFISGVAGFLGSHLADSFIEEGHDVFGCDNLIGGYLDNVPPEVDFHQYDLNYFKGIANFGDRPTVDGTKMLLEVHLFDFNQNIYGKDLTVEFLTFIRDEIKFSNFDQLTEQIQKDIQIAKNYHGI